jgi:hypothetical protein
LRERRDIGLRVSAVHAERVQLEDLAREILVDAGLASPCRACRRTAQRGIRADRAWLSRYSSMAGCCSTANSRSVKLPVTRGRIGFALHRTGDPSTAILSMDTAK